MDEIIKFLKENFVYGNATNTHLNIVQWLHDNGISKDEYMQWPNQAQQQDSPNTCKCEYPDFDAMPFGNHCLACNGIIRR